MAEMTTSEKINLAYAKVVDDIKRIVQQAIESNNDIILGHLDDIATAQVSAVANYKDTLKSELKSAREKQRNGAKNK
jgi:hypothetical protein